MGPLTPRILTLAATLFLAGTPAFAGFPDDIYPDCAEDGTLDACPPDMLSGDGEWRGITWSFTSFINPDYQRHVRRDEWSMGSGNWMDKATQLTVGRYEVTVAVIDSGVRWRDGGFVPKTLLNPGELPSPIGADGQVCGGDDCNGDGYFTVVDFAADPRVDVNAGSDDADGRLDPSDLIPAFSDGLDGDGNGFIDDIAGWDFMWNDNDPKATNDFYHGSAVMTDATATSGELGSSLGYCPNCAVLPVRVSDSFIGEANKIAEGVLYAVDRGAKVIAIAMGSLTNSEYLREAFQYAWANDVLVVVAIGDELSYHHLPPGANDFTLPVHSITHYPFIGPEQARSFLAYRGCNNYGSHLALVATTNDCATGSVAIISGIAGMVYSMGLERGLELSVDEVRALLTSQADDIDVRESRGPRSPYFPSHPGWDQFFGYGRVNAYSSVRAVAEGRIPPEVHILTPRLFEVLDPRTSPVIAIDVHMDAPRESFYDYQLEWAPGGDARDSDFRTLKSGSGSDELTGTLFEWPVASIPRELLDPAEAMDVIGGDDALIDKLKMTNKHAITLRLKVTDSRGNEAEHRKTLFLHEDPDLLPAFPKDIGPGDSSPVLADLNNDGIDDIIIGSSDGLIQAFDGLGRSLPGWPQAVGFVPSTDPSLPGNHLGAPAHGPGGVAAGRQGILGAVNVADLDNDGTLEVLASTLDGFLFAFEHDGTQRSGFPVTRDPVSDAQTSEMLQMDPGFAAGAVTADLDGDGDLEIVLPGMDQKVYVWEKDGTRHPGFPVRLETSGSEDNNRGRIMSTPAIGDMDGDGDLEIAMGSNEYDGTRLWLTYVYAIHHDGNLHEGGAVLRGWPVPLMGILNSIVRYMGEGVTMSPVMGDIDGDGAMEVAFAAPGWCPDILDYRGRIVSSMSCDSSGWGALRDSDEVAAATYLGNVEFKDVNGDGRPEVIAGVTGVNWAASLLLSRWMPYQDHMVLVWDAQTGQALPAWPRVIEDIMMFVKPGTGDITGDGSPEVLMSSGGYLAHGWTVDGEEVPGWPKFTGGWIYSAIRVGDITGDGFNEVIAVTREGLLWVWGTPGVNAP